MATVRYTVTGVPERYMHAWCPTAGLTPAGQTHGDTLIYGSPGTTRVPSPRPRFDKVAREMAGDGFQNGSDVAPDWFAPQVWFTDIRNRGPLASAGGVHYMPGREAPVPPAIRPEGGVSGVAMNGRKVGKVMKWPRVITRWRADA